MIQTIRNQMMVGIVVETNLSDFDVMQQSALSSRSVNEPTHQSGYGITNRVSPQVRLLHHFTLMTPLHRHLQF